MKLLKTDEVAKQSLARLRKGVKARLKAGSNALLCRNIFNQGDEGCYRDERIYRG